MSMAKAIGALAPIIVTVEKVATTAVDGHVFVAPVECRLRKVSEVHAAAGAASSTLQLEKCAAGEAPGSGTDILSTAFALDSTVDTAVEKTSADMASVEAATFAEGDALALDFTGTTSAYTGALTFVFVPVGRPPDY